MYFMLCDFLHFVYLSLISNLSILNIFWVFADAECDRFYQLLNRLQNLKHPSQDAGSKEPHFSQ